VNATAAATLPRQQKLDRLLERERLEALVACSYEALCYFARTDIQTQLHLADRLEFLVALSSGPPTLLICDIEEPQVRTQTPISDVRAYVEFADDPATKLAELLSERGVARGRVGIEARRLPTEAMRTLGAQLPEIEWVAIDRALEHLQAAKTEGEVDQLSSLANSLLDALDATIASNSGDVGEDVFAGELLARVARTGALPLFLVFAAGERTTLGHPEPRPTPLQAGSIWRADFGARLPGGILGDVARTGVVGSPDPDQEEIFAAVRAAQDAAVALAQPGRPARELYDACKRALERSGIPFLMPHVGHGIGIGLHEPPLLEPRNEAPLAEGTVLNVEPFAILADRGEGYHTEDLILVTGQGPHRLTTPQDELLSIRIDGRTGGSRAVPNSIRSR
jgi:Xaa-Pro aminopeptidase